MKGLTAGEANKAALTETTRRQGFLTGFGSLASLLPLFLLLGALYVFPITRAIYLSLGGDDPTLAHYTNFFSTGVYVHVLWNTVLTALLVTLACLVIGYPIAYFLASTSRMSRNIVFAVVLAPWLVSELVRNFSWLIILQSGGVLSQVQRAAGFSGDPVIEAGTFAAMFIGMIYVQLPLAILPIYAVIQRLDLSLLTVATSLGGRPHQVIRTVLIPLSLPGIMAAAVLTFLTSLGFYITPMLLGGPSDLFMANLIDVQISRLVNWEFGSALASVLVLSGLGVMALASKLIGWKWLLGEAVSR